MTDGERHTTRDWFWLLGRVGQTLIALGVLVFLFIGYQLWGTGIEESQAQNRLERTFRDVASSTTVASADEPVVTTPDVTTPDVTTPVVTAPVVPVDVAPGDPVAIIEIPKIGVSKFVVEGVDPADLKKGPGRYPGTVQLGHLGNSAIAGHRTTYGQPFRQLDELVAGDEIVITDLYGREFVYAVDTTMIVQPTDTWVVDNTDPTRAKLTLTTCHPEFSARERLVVTAYLDESKSTAVENMTVAPTDPSSTPTTSAPLDTAPPTTAPLGPVIDDEPAVTGDVFSSGWFSDSAAWPHVGFWLSVELVVVALAWLALRRWRRRVLTTVVALVPFLVVLYFVFQNVNRLLPPNL